jgi:hypothetical protein
MRRDWWVMPDVSVWQEGVAQRLVSPMGALRRYAEHLRPIFKADPETPTCSGSWPDTGM